jgi:hypothetical protein
MRAASFECVFDSVELRAANETAPGRCLRTESEGLATPSRLSNWSRFL